MVKPLPDHYSPDGIAYYREREIYNVLSKLVQRNQHKGIPGMISAYLHKMRNNWLTLLLVHLIFVLLGIVILGPLFGFLVQYLVELSGNPAVADQDIARLLLTPLGMGSAVLLAGIFLAISAMEIGALLVVAMAAERSFNCTPLQATWDARRHAVGFFVGVLIMPGLTGEREAFSFGRGSKFAQTHI